MTKSPEDLYDLLIQGSFQNLRLTWTLGRAYILWRGLETYSALLRNLDFMLEEMRKCYQLKVACDCLTWNGNGRCGRVTKLHRY